MFDYINGVFMILQEELESVTYWSYYGSVEQYKLPFSDVNSPVRKAGLGLLSIRRHKTPCVNYGLFFSFKAYVYIHLKHMYTVVGVEIRNRNNNTWSSGKNLVNVQSCSSNLYGANWGHHTSLDWNQRSIF